MWASSFDTLMTVQSRKDTVSNMNAKSCHCVKSNVCTCNINMKPNMPCQQIAADVLLKRSEGG